MTGDMTRGPIAKTLIAFSVPLILSGILQQMYGWADALVVGNFAGESALAAVGTTGTLTTLVISLLAGFTTGMSIMISQLFGSGEHDAVTKTASTFTAFTIAASTALSVLCFFAAGPLLSLLKTPADVFDMALTYTRIIYVGVPFLAAYNIYTACLRGIGDSRTPLVALVVSSVVNIALDLLFVAVFRWGIAGAAWATVISQAAVAFFTAIYSRRRSALMRFSFGRAMLDKALFSRGIRLGLPIAGQRTVRIGGQMMLQHVMNGFGSTVVAAITSAYRIDTVAMMPVIYLGSGISTFTGQNIGAGNRLRARKGLYVGSAAAALVAGVIIAVIVPFGGRIIGIFGVGAQAAGIGGRFLITCAMFYPIFAVNNALTGYLQGLGDVYFTSLAGFGELAVRLGVSYAMRGTWGHAVIAWAEIISWLFLLAALGGRYLYLRRARPDKT